MSKHKHGRRPLSLPDPGPWLLVADLEIRDHPRESLVIVPISEGDVWDILTFPLPDADDSLSCQVLALLVERALAGRAEIDMVHLVIFSSRRARRPFENAQFAVMARLHGRGVHFGGCHYVSDRGWGSYVCDHPECAGPRPLAELAEGARMLAALGDSD